MKYKQHITLEAGCRYAIEEKIKQYKNMGWKRDGDMVIAYRSDGLVCEMGGFAPWDYYAQHMWKWVNR